jgi:hypothetical protein
MEVFRDNSPWAFTHTIGFAANVMSVNVMAFWVFVLFVFWLGELTSKQAVAEAKKELGRTVMAGGSE